MYFCLRNGLHDLALCVAGATSCNGVLEMKLGGVGLKIILEDWLRNNRRLSDEYALLLTRVGGMLMKDGRVVGQQLCDPYRVLICGLLSGDHRVVTCLGSAMGNQQPVLATLEDFMWFKLCMIPSPVGFKIVPSVVGEVVPPCHRFFTANQGLTRWQHKLLIVFHSFVCWCQGYGHQTNDGFGAEI